MSWEDDAAGQVAVSRNVYDACRYHLPKDPAARGISPRGSPRSPRLSYNGDMISPRPRMGAPLPSDSEGLRFSEHRNVDLNAPSRTSKEFARFHNPPLSRRMVSIQGDLGPSCSPREYEGSVATVSPRPSSPGRDPIRWAPGEEIERVAPLPISEGAAGAPSDHPLRFDTEGGRTAGLGRARSATPDYYKRYRENLVGCSLHNTMASSTPSLAGSARGRTLGMCDPVLRNPTPSYHNKQDCRFHGVPAGKRHLGASPRFRVRQGSEASIGEPRAAQAQMRQKPAASLEDQPRNGTGVRFAAPAAPSEASPIAEKENNRGSVIWAGAQDKQPRGLVGARPLQTPAIPASGVKVTYGLDPEAVQSARGMRAGGLPSKRAPGTEDFDMIQSANGTMKVVSPRPYRYEPSPIC